MVGAAKRAFSRFDESAMKLGLPELLWPACCAALLRRAGRCWGWSSASRFQAHSDIESLEQRALLSVSLDPNGWTVVTPPASAHIIYCSSSTGNDTNNGLSPAAPVQTLAHAISLLRDHSADQLLLKRGDVWHSDLGVWRKSGKSAEQPMVIGAYGTGNRPELMTGAESGFDAISNINSEIDNVDIIGIHFYSDGRDPTSPDFSGPVNATGIDVLTKTSNFLVEDCQIEGYFDDINLQAFYGPIANVQIRRNVIDDAYATSSNSEGLYAYGVTNLLIEGNTFDHNGYNDLVPGGQATWFNHDCYLAANNVNCTVRGNIFAEAAGYGLQARAGGDIENNLFINDPVGMTFGLVNGADVAPGGATGVVNGNVFIGGANIGTIQGGSGLQIGNTRPGYPTVISNNIFTTSVPNAPAAITLAYGMGDSNPQDAVGINDLNIEDNIIDNWNNGVFVDSGFQPGGTGLQAFNNVQIRNNVFQNITGTVVTHGQPISKSQEHWTGNIYPATSGAVVMDKKPLSMTQWRASAETGAQSASVDYADAGASIELYNSTVGGLPAVSDFLAQARLQSSQNWRAAYDAQSIIAYFQQAFGEVGAPARSWVAPTPPVATPSLPGSVLAQDTILTFTVDYDDPRAIDPTTIASGNVNVVGKGGLNAAAQLIATSATGNIASATYAVSVPANYFRPGVARKLTVMMNANQVKSGDGFAAMPGPVGAFRVRVLPRPKPPVVKSIKLTNHGQSIAVRFSENVGAGIEQSALTLSSADGQTINGADLPFSWDAAHDTGTWTFSNEVSGILPAGRWSAHLSASMIVNSIGQQLDGNYNGIAGDDYIAKTPIIVKAIKSHSS